MDDSDKLNIIRSNPALITGNLTEKELKSDNYKDESDKYKLSYLKQIAFSDETQFVKTTLNTKYLQKLKLRKLEKRLEEDETYNPLSMFNPAKRRFEGKYSWYCFLIVVLIVMFLLIY